MSDPYDPTEQEILASISQGIEKAQIDYKDAYMSHISSNYAPEYFMTVNIFQSLLRLNRKYGCKDGLSLEESVYDLVRDLKTVKGLKAGGRYLESARVYGNCDLSLRDIEYNPRSVIEVKKYAWDYTMDYKRLAYLVE